MPELKVAWKARKDNSLIGKDIPRIDGVDKASGKAKYSADINTEGTLFARLLTFKGGAATVKTLDTADAEKTPGVRAVHVFNGVGKEVRWDGTIVAASASQETLTPPAPPATDSPSPRATPRPRLRRRARRAIAAAAR